MPQLNSIGQKLEKPVVATQDIFPLWHIPQPVVVAVLVLTYRLMLPPIRKLHPPNPG
jgi:hypothetical protein